MTSGSLLVMSDLLVGVAGESGQLGLSALGTCWSVSTVCSGLGLIRLSPEKSIFLSSLRPRVNRTAATMPQRTATMSADQLWPTRCDRAHQSAMDRNSA